MFASRRRFLQSSAVAATLGLAGSSSRAADPGPAHADADLVLLNGTVYTVDDVRPKVEAFAVRHGRFLAIESTAEVRSLATPKTTVIDAVGMTVGKPMEVKSVNGTSNVASAASGKKKTAPASKGMS